MLVAVFLLAAIAAVLIIAEARKERTEPTRVEVEEQIENWSWPERNVGPVGRTHLGRRS